MRDLILGREVAFFGVLFDNYFVLVSALTSLAVFLFARFLRKWYITREKQILKVNNFIDAIGIGAFCVSTLRICLNHDPDMSAFLAISMGLIAAIGGGMIRDICLRDIPFVFRKHIYAVACIIGCSFYYLCAAVLFRGNETAEVISAIVTMAMVFTIRVLATIFRWNIPKAIPAPIEQDGKTENKREEKELV